MKMEEFPGITRSELIEMKKFLLATKISEIRMNKQKKRNNSKDQ